MYICKQRGVRIFHGMLDKAEFYVQLIILNKSNYTSMYIFRKKVI